MLQPKTILPVIGLFLLACKERTAPSSNTSALVKTTKAESVKKDTAAKTIHVLVALCDNKYQGIVKVPAGIGNGQNAKTNLYWGAGYGIKSYFTNKSSDWKLISSTADTSRHILERLLFKHKTKEIYLLAEAYDGRYILETVDEFLNISAGMNVQTEKINGKEILFGGAADLVCYVGHNGMMDGMFEPTFEKQEGNKKDAIILACLSKSYFGPYLKNTGATPVLWTTGLMAPEAYTLHDAIHEWVADRPITDIRTAAANAYAKYQKCGTKAAMRLLVSGW